MSYLRLTDVCLDYILKIGNRSLKKATLDSMRYMVSGSRNKSLSNQCYRAINNLTLEIKNGDRIGLLGRNGAGKSTLLRVLGKIYPPTTGKLECEGTISALLDMNVGLNGEATGYENIIVLGMLRGKTRKAMIGKFKEIEEFTELGDFLKAPVRSYSSGMCLRLAFAVLTAIETDIILLDEIITVLDSTFMTKAKTRLTELIDKSHILVISSHSSDIIRQFCNKVIVLHRGEIKFMGDVEQGLRVAAEQKSTHLQPSQDAIEEESIIAL